MRRRQARPAARAARTDAAPTGGALPVGADRQDFAHHPACAHDGSRRGGSADPTHAIGSRPPASRRRGRSPAQSRGRSDAATSRQAPLQVVELPPGTTLDLSAPDGTTFEAPCDEGRGEDGEGRGMPARRSSRVARRLIGPNYANVRTIGRARIPGRTIPMRQDRSPQRVVRRSGRTEKLDEPAISCPSSYRAAGSRTECPRREASRILSHGIESLVQRLASGWRILFFCRNLASS